ncbi:MAG TPA: terminase large subunit [Patescibacteria group bacterium]|nr:terminase large subunit [Patescibacteria group bacterium]
MVPDALSGGPHFAAYCERYVRHTKGRWAGQPLVFEPWQREFWWEALEFDPATGLRIYNEVGLGIPRKNTKSTTASAAGLYMLDADGEPEPEVYVAAAARNQAGIVLGQARSMVKRSPLLLDRLVPRRYAIECPRNGGIMRSLSSDAALQHGLNPSANIVDELHAHKSPELYTALTTGTGAREQPFTLWITTAGVAGEGILSDLYESMFSGSGTLEDRGSLLIYRDRANGTLIYWYGAPRDADIEDPAVWFAANPVSYLHDGKYLGAQFARLKARGALLEWRRYHLNQFVGFEDTWLRPGAWADTTGDLPLNVALPVGVGIDRSPDGEHAAIVVAQRQADRVVVRSQVFAPESATGIVSTAAMRARLRELRAEYPLAQIADPKTRRPLPGPAFALDRTSLGEMADSLAEDGLNVVDVPMTAAHMAPPSMTTFELITTGRLVHDGDPILAQHVANTTAVLTDRGMKVTRSKHGSTRPNVACVALIRAVDMAMQEPPVPFSIRKPRKAVGF